MCCRRNPGKRVDEMTGNRGDIDNCPISPVQGRREALTLVRDDSRRAWRASRRGAERRKKFTSKTRCHSSRSPFKQPRRSLKGVFGDHPALFTSACKGLSFNNSFASSMKLSRLFVSVRSAVIWWLQFGSRRHSSGGASREQVMISQFRSLKRRTVAWPIPRLAPVNSIVF